LFFTLIRVQLRSFEARWIIRKNNWPFAPRMSEAGKLVQKFFTTLPYALGNVVFVIGKIQEWCRSAVFLALKEHWSSGAQEQRGSQGFGRPNRGWLLGPPAISGIGNLIMILNVIDKRR